MPKLKNLSGEDLTKIFFCFGFEVIGQKGSHVKLARNLSDETRQTLTIPNHSELDKGTLKAIYRQAARYISEYDLKNHFYAE